MVGLSHLQVYYHRVRHQFKATKPRLDLPWQSVTYSCHLYSGANDDADIRFTYHNCTPSDCYSQSPSRKRNFSAVLQGGLYGTHDI